MLQARFVRTYEDLVAGVVPNSLYPGRHCAGHNHVEQLSRWHAAMRVAPKTGRAAIGTALATDGAAVSCSLPLSELSALPDAAVPHAHGERLPECEVDWSALAGKPDRE